MARTLYRVIESNPPTLRDFLSYAAVGKVPRPGAPADLPRRWTAVSTYSDKEVARTLALTRPQFGTFIVTLQIEEGAPIRIEQTGRREHHDLWGEPAELLARVVAVEPV